MLRLPTNLLQRLFSGTAKKYITVHTSEVRQIIHIYKELSDEQLKEECAKALAGESILGSQARKPSLLSQISSALFNLVLKRPQVDHKTSKLALAIECFSRAPADLPRGSLLYKEQIAAAQALTHNCLVQMDTGEGKTYAILPAAFVLGCDHTRIYILCASEYLAWRDASRTHTFWDFVGISVGLAVAGSEPSEWSKRVVYTTLECLIVRALQCEINPEAPSHPITYAALILDEADAILLDQGSQTYAIVHPVRGDAFDWNLAIDHARGLKVGRDITVDHSDLTATLTLEAEVKLQESLGARGIDPLRLLFHRYAIELAFVATRVVIENTHYIVERDRVHPIDPISGKVMKGMTPGWVVPLEASLGFTPRPKTVTLHEGSPFIFLSRFAHLSGTSGTIIHDYIEYLFTHRLLSVVIPPRYERRGKEDRDQISRLKSTAYSETLSRTRTAVESGQPVLVGAQTITDAEAIFHLFRQELGSKVRLNLLTGKDDRQKSQIFERGGEVGSVIVATQLAGRGVDIRLTDEARRNGGMALICMGHAKDPRHDRQFAGRVGRHGEPYSLVFVCSLEDELFKIFGGDWISRLMTKLGIEESDRLEHKLIDRAIRNAQRQYWRHSFLVRQHANYDARTQSRISSEVLEWFRYLQVPVSGTDEKAHADNLSQDFLERVVEHFIYHNLSSLISGEKEVSQISGDQMVTSIGETLRLERNQLPVRTIDIEGYSGETARSIIIRNLLSSIRDALKMNVQRRDVFHEKLRIAFGLSSIRRGLKQILHLFSEKHKGISYELQDALQKLLRELSAAIADHDLEDEPVVLEVNDLLKEIRETFSIVDTEGTPKKEMPLPEENPSPLGAGTELLTSEGDSANLKAFNFESFTERLGRIVSRIEQIERTTIPRLELLTRTNRMVAAWSIRLVWMQFLEERDRIKHRLSIKGYSIFTYFRAVSDTVMKEWRRLETLMSASVLSNLLRAGELDDLDSLFLLSDNKADVEPQQTRLEFRWKPSQVVEAPQYAPQDRTIAFIRQFVDLQEPFLISRSFTASTLFRLLKNFCDRSALNLLQSPLGIQRALESWFEYEVEMGVSRRRCLVNRRWLRKFLLFLHERNLVGPLPTIKHRIQSNLQRLSLRATEPRDLLMGAEFMILFAVFVLCFRFGNLFPPHQLELWWAYIDSLLFGGTLGSGNILAPIMGPLLLGSALVYLTTSADKLPYRGMGLDRFVTPILQVIITCWLVWGAEQREGGALGAVLDTVLLIAAVGLAVLVGRVVWLIYNMSLIDLYAPWVFYCALFFFLPSICPADMHPVIFVVLVCLLAGLFVLRSELNSKEVRLKSVHIGHALRMDEAEEVSTNLKVTVERHFAPYVFGVVFAALASELAHTAYPFLMTGQVGTDATICHVVGGLVFLVVVIGWSAASLQRKFGVRAWKSILSSRRQIIADVLDERALERRLRILRRSLFAREALVNLLFFASASWLLWVETLPGTHIPLSTVVIAVGAMLGEYLRRFSIGLYHFAYSTGTVTQELLDLSTEDIPEDDTGIFGAIKRALSNRLALILTIMIILIKGIDALVNLLKLIWTH